MTQVNVTPAVATGDALNLRADLSVARTKLVKAAKGTGEVIKAYGAALVAVFGAEWWALKGTAKKPLKEERDQFVLEMTAAGFGKPTIDVYWQRVKEASGYVTAGNRVKGEVSVDTKNLDDLRTMINRIFKAEEDGVHTDWSDEKDILIDLFTRMGGDEDKLG